VSSEGLAFGIDGSSLQLVHINTQLVAFVCSYGEGRALVFADWLGGDLSGWSVLYFCLVCFWSG